VAAAAAGVLASEAGERPGPAVGVASAGASVEPVVVEETTYLIVPDDGEQATAYRVPGERTVEMRQSGYIPGDMTQVIGTMGEETRIILRRDVDDTQVIRRPDDGERTQVLRLPPTQLPGRDEPAEDRPGTGRGGSIVGAESPNFADDPTGRLVFPEEQPEEPARTMTVMNMERPPEVPAPRKSPESQE
jgi:hypothetical protein